MADFLHDLQTHPNPLERNPFYQPSYSFYVSQTNVILRHILYDLSSPPTPLSTIEPTSYTRMRKGDPRLTKCISSSVLAS